MSEKNSAAHDYDDAEDEVGDEVGDEDGDLHNAIFPTWFFDAPS